MTKHYLLTKDDVVNNLTSTETKKPLSANQGKVLADQNTSVGNRATSLESRATSLESRATALEAKTANATTSSKGIVQVGSGLSVTDGVVSVNGSSISMTFSSVSTTNNGGFKIGEYQVVIPAFSWTKQYLNYSTFKTLVTVTPKSFSLLNCPPFAIDSSKYSEIAANLSVSFVFDDVKELMRLRVINASGTVLADSGEVLNVSTVTVAAPIPYGTSAFSIQGYCQHEEMPAKVNAYSGSETTLTANVYYNPVTS